MKIKLLDEKTDEDVVFYIGGWDCMKIGFMSGLGWTMVWVVFYILIFILAIVFGQI